MEEKVMKATKEKIEEILKEGITSSNLNLLYQLVDIQKDIEEIKSERSENMNYGRYSEYGARMRDSRGRYMARGYGENYGARYKGHDYIDEMYGNYGRYEEGRGSYNRGNYGAKGETLDSLECMLEAAADFMKMLKEEATSPEEMELVHKYIQKISK